MTKKQLLIATIAILLIPIAVICADQLTVCRGDNCWKTEVPNMKTWEWKTAADGTKFVRVLTHDGHLVDIYGKELSVTAVKKQTRKKNK